MQRVSKGQPVPQALLGLRGPQGLRWEVLRFAQVLRLMVMMGQVADARVLGQPSAMWTPITVVQPPPARVLAALMENMKALSIVRITAHVVSVLIDENHHRTCLGVTSFHQQCRIWRLT